MKFPSRPVPVVVLGPEPITVENEVERLAREYDIWEPLVHPRVLPLLGYVDIAPGLVALVALDLGGTDIRTYLRNNPDAKKRRLVRVLSLSSSVEQYSTGRSYKSPKVLNTSIARWG